MSDDVSIDEWKPNLPEKKLIQSKWRKEIIGDNYNQEVGLDELKKINMALKKKRPDYEILQAYGISSETLVRIKEGKLTPDTGNMRGKLESDNNFDELLAIRKKINVLQSRIYGITSTFKELAKILYSDKDQQMEFLRILERKRKNERKSDDDDIM